MHFSHIGCMKLTQICRKFATLGVLYQKLSRQRSLAIDGKRESGLSDDLLALALFDGEKNSEWLLQS